MAIVSGTFTKYDAIGLREDLSDIIYNISPTDTPFMSSIPQSKATAVTHEWQLDSLAAASGSNAQVEGNEVTFSTPGVTTRKSNVTQISTKSVVISGTLEAVNKAGRNSELAYQISKASKELKRDMETSLLANTTVAAGSTSTARTLAGIVSWLKTNESTSGTAPTTSGTATRTDGTQRAFTEDQLKSVIKQVWDNGGDPSMVMVGSFNKQKLSGFTGGSTRFDPAENKRLVAAVDVYESDFGALQVTPNRFQRTRDALIITPDLFAVSYLRDFSLEDLAKTGDAMKQFLVAEYTLESRNEAGSGIVADLTTS